MTTLNTENLKSLVNAIGTDVKKINTTLATKVDKSEIGQGGITQQQLETAIAGVKTAILGEGVTELGQKLTDLETTDFVQVYNSAKNTL